MTDVIEQPSLRIGALADRAGVSTRALRYYEEQGLLGAERTPSGQRVYGATAVDRVFLIRQLYAAGLSSRTILSVLPCVDTGHATPAIVDVLVTERDRITSAIADLETARGQLDHIIAIARDHDSTECTVAGPAQGR